MTLKLVSNNPNPSKPDEPVVEKLVKINDKNLLVLQESMPHILECMKHEKIETIEKYIIHCFESHMDYVLNYEIPMDKEIKKSRKRWDEATKQAELRKSKRKAKQKKVKE